MAQVSTPSDGPCAAGAGSCIESIDDTTPSDGQAITAVGQDLHQETMAGWSTRWTTTYPTAWSFEGPDFASMGWNKRGQLEEILTVKPLMGSQHARFNNRTLSSTCHPAKGQGIGTSQVDTLGEAPPQDVWLRWYTNFTFGSVGAQRWPQAYMKHTELFNGVHYFQPVMAFGAAPSQWNIYSIATPITNRQYSIPGGKIVMDRWYLFEAHAVSGAGGTLEFYINNTQIASESWATVPAWEIFMVGLINACALAPGQSWDIIADMDGVAYGTQRIGPSAKIEICKESSYASCKAKQWQFPRYISETSVTFNFTKGKLKKGTGYVYITNNKGEVSVGQAITIP
jgi:hypothetical protein